MLLNHSKEDIYSGIKQHLEDLD